MQRKIFISVNLPERDKKRLVRAIEKWQALPIKWVRPQNLHLTLSFLGFMPDSEIAEICERTDSAAREKDIFDIDFDHIEIGPTEQEQRLIWLTGEPNEELKNLQEAIEKSLGIFIKEKKSFRPHITLGRIRQHKWAALEAAPKIAEKFPLTVTVESVDVMASEFENEDMEYAVVKSCPLK